MSDVVSDALSASTVDPDEAAVAAALDAGLVHVVDAVPGIRRVRCGSGFRYLGPDGSSVSAADRDRIRELAIPPAWTDVWICRDAEGHLQATGRDARDRKQYRYHPRWREVRDADKFGHLAQFGAGLGPLRRQVEEELCRRGRLDRDKVLALVVRLLDETLIRVGNAEYASTNDSYGLTTLGPEHVDVVGAEIAFHFVGKGGVEHDLSVTDRRLARLVRRCHELGGQELFAWTEASGRLVDVTSADVNDWLRERTGDPVTAKDFRTWGATVVAAEHLVAEGRPESDADVDRQVLGAIDAAAEQLGNTRAVCRASYVHPVVPEAHRDGRLHDHWDHSRTTRDLRRGERAVLALLEG